MELPRLRCECQCGQTVQPHLLVLTPKRQLLVIGYCLNCNEQVQTVFRLQDLINACPALPTIQLAQAIDSAIEEITCKDKFDELSEADIIRLHGMCIEGGT